MALNIKAINEVLQKTPLCGHALIAQKGMAMEYCAMGALAKACGATDKDLMNYSPSGGELYKDYQIPLLEKFGIENLNQFQTLMTFNDGAKNSATRNDEVRGASNMMAVEEIVQMVKDSEALVGE